ncbi:Gamma-crystallin M2 [Bagarius yarrelli]|uniref:Gamma-crystallin M2 n=1 Tax=Bagarius yarrelli TaxID=175774 RepID=A0A556TYG6_BAGYA|nr:Gamma-crystallin M2 [Bagarius yarrelli]
MLLAQEFKQKEAQVFSARARYKWETGVKPCGVYGSVGTGKEARMSMGKIIFYEGRNFTGRFWECGGDCPNMAAYLNRCYSCRVESGCWMVYDRPNFMGNQYFLRKGEYNDYISTWGMNGWIRSCRWIPRYSGSYRMRLYPRENFMGQMMEMSDDCDSFLERYNWSHGCMSCHVTDGHWLMYEFHYKGRMWYFGPGQYRNYRHMMGMRSMRFMSMRRILDSWYN